MRNMSDMARRFSRTEKLQRELNLRLLQINGLLTITQAINNNVSAEELYGMYNSFLDWELDIRKMALYVRQDEDESTDQWRCATYIGLNEQVVLCDLSPELSQFKSLTNLEYDNHPLLKEFDLVIPVLHKDMPIAYVFIGGFNEEDDMYSKMQFITTITNIIAVAIENKRLFRRQLEQERLKREMELAREMQMMLIPQDLPVTGRYELASLYKPHYGVGGDYFDFIEFPDSKLVFCIGDISGKGIAAALLMANFQANFHTLINKRTHLEEFIISLNQSVNRITNGERFITFFIAEYDIPTKTLRYVNAGHNPPVLINGGELELLSEGCTILGSFPKLPSIGIGEVQLKGDAIILAYTDGLIDLQNEAGDYFDEERLHQFVLDHHPHSARNFNNYLQRRIEDFKGNLGYPDDFTVLTCRIPLASDRK